MACVRVERGDKDPDVVNILCLDRFEAFAGQRMWPVVVLVEVCFSYDLSVRLPSIIFFEPRGHFLGINSSPAALSFVYPVHFFAGGKFHRLASPRQPRRSCAAVFENEKWSLLEILRVATSA